MKTAIVTDEISNDFEYALKRGTEWGIKHFELRRINTGRIPDISENEKKLILETARKYSVDIVALSPGLFKDTLDSEKTQTDAGERLIKTFQTAHLMGAEKIIIFGFTKSSAGKNHENRELSHIADILGESSEKARKAGLTLCLENEAGCYADTGKATAEIVSLVNHPNLKINWDPGNAMRAGEKPFPDGYLHVKNHMSHLHIKDFKTDGEEKKWVPLGKGEIDWKSQVRALEEDGYRGYWVIETHCAPKEENSMISIEALRTLTANKE